MLSALFLPMACGLSGKPALNKLSRAAILDRLDQVPCFVIVDALRLPPPDDSDITSLYLSTSEARVALAAAQERHPSLQLEIQPVGLGFALDSPTACLVPAAMEVARARDLPGSEEIDWDASTVPLFGCPSLQQLDREGNVVSPLFFSCDDAAAAIAAAEVAAMARGDESMMELAMRTISLQDMTRRMEQGMSADPADFAFVPAADALRLLATLDQSSTEAPDGAVAREALRATFDGTRQSKVIRDTGLFPS